jgi:hypothetical protein
MSAVPSNANLREAIKALLKHHNYDPFKEMILIAKDPDTDRKTRAGMATELAQYIAPKLKGIDIDAKASGSISVVIQRFAQEIMDEDEPKTLELAPEDAVEVPETQKGKSNARKKISPSEV